MVRRGRLHGNCSRRVNAAMSKPYNFVKLLTHTNPRFKLLRSVQLPVKLHYITGSDSTAFGLAFRLDSYNRASPIPIGMPAGTEVTFDRGLP